MASQKCPFDGLARVHGCEDVSDDERDRQFGRQSLPIGQSGVEVEIAAGEQDEIELVVNAKLLKERVDQ
ncbi:hypothetical protein WOLCODRAFT_148624 [Wolfiporia cocos MD-104 SS10]|uniref:Uncharacterized protein n=1 Tax=Wolfiporia cocos (strain MD-104) TaxID=742152 RepID=A0A2H3JM03_WOLCO|nr:hypothetical protein WOLCODRAFT_148624 [Wolfiporia cocos MD-104 SS10]